MSTKVTIVYGENYHIYSECFEEDEAIHLRLDGPNVEFEAWPNGITVRIPKNIIEAILNNADEIRERFKNNEDWNETQELQEWKKSE